MENSMEKITRAKNFTESEVKVFTEFILPKFKDIIENKRTDAVTRGEKAEAWRQLCIEFNAVSQFCHRTEKNLKNLWDKLKKSARKSKATERRETFATGGGQRDSSADPSSTDLRVLALLGPSGVGLINHCDGDAEVQEVAEMSSNEDAATAVPALTNAVTVPNLDFGSIIIPLPQEEPQAGSSKEADCNWAEVVPRMLYSKKAECLRPICETASTSSSSGSGSPTLEGVRKRTLAQELEWAKQCKRRRPAIVQDEIQVKLAHAKFELTEATKKRLDEENERNKELFEIEKRRKESEAELAQLQVLKMKRDLGLE